MTEPNVEDIAELRKDPDSFRDYLRHITGRTVTAPQGESTETAAVPDPGYRIAHTGGWPLGTAATGPTPPPDVCTCVKCGGNPNSSAVHRQIGDVA